MLACRTDLHRIRHRLGSDSQQQHTEDFLQKRGGPDSRLCADVDVTAAGRFQVSELAAIASPQRHIQTQRTEGIFPMCVGVRARLSGSMWVTHFRLLHVKLPYLRVLNTLRSKTGQKVSYINPGRGGTKGGKRGHRPPTSEPRPQF